MHLQPSSRQGELIALARRLACERFAPRADRHDCAASFPFDDYADLRAEGLLGLCVPERYGGLGGDYETYCLVAEQLAQGNASTALTFNMHCLTMLMMGPIADSMPMSPTVRERHEKLRAAQVPRGRGGRRLLWTAAQRAGGAGRNRYQARCRRPALRHHRAEGGWRLCGERAEVFCLSGGLRPVLRHPCHPARRRALDRAYPVSRDSQGGARCVLPRRVGSDGDARHSQSRHVAPGRVCPRRRGGAAARRVRGDVQRLPPPLPELLGDFPRAHASGLRRCPRLPDRPDAGRAEPAHRDRGKRSCDSRDALCNRIRPRALLPSNLGGPGRCSAGGGPARPGGARHRATRGSHGHPGGDPCLWRTGLPQALSARALRARRAGRRAHAPVDSGDRDAAGLGGRAWLGRAAGRCRRGVTVLSTGQCRFTSPHEKGATAWEVSAMGRNLGRFAVVSALSLALAAPIADAQKSGGILIMSHFDSPASMSMHEEATGAINRPMMGVFNNLILYRQDVAQNSMASIVPELATGWSWNEDGTELTLPLRRGVNWHDGKPFTARDVKCTWDLLTGRSAERLRVNPRKSWYSNLEEVTANGDYEVTFRLKRP